jgi:hypothetical protein
LDGEASVKRIYQMRPIALVAVTALALPMSVSAQRSIGVRAGTLGLGGEVSVGFAKRFAVRGGVGTFPVEYTGIIGDLEYTITAPKRLWNVGLDVYPFGGGFHIGAGVLNRAPFDLGAEGRQTANIGGRDYEGDLAISGDVSNDGSTAPYAIMGFGRATGRRAGIYLELGAAFLGDTRVKLTGTCTEAPTGQPCPEFEQRLQQEAREVEDEVGSYIRIHPIIQLGFRVGL